MKNLLLYIHYAWLVLATLMLIIDGTDTAKEAVQFWGAIVASNVFLAAQMIVNRID